MPELKFNQWSLWRLEEFWLETLLVEIYPDISDFIGCVEYSGTMILKLIFVGL